MSLAAGVALERFAVEASEGRPCDPCLGTGAAVRAAFPRF